MKATTERDARILSALSPEFVARFWARVDKTGECWTWTKYRTPMGYGHLHLPRNRGPGYSVLAHRVSWLMSKGQIPEATPHVLHRCDNPPCVRPGHLFLGDDALNHRDMLNKGRESRGEMRNIKLTEADVLEIRRLYPEGGHTHRSLAAMFNTCHATIASVLHRRLWTHL